MAREFERPTTSISAKAPAPTYPEDFSLFKETVKNIPKNLVKVPKTFAQGAARGFAASVSAPIAGYGSIAKSIKEGKPTYWEPQFNVDDPKVKFGPGQKLAKATFGDKPFSLTSETVELQDFFRNKDNPVAGQASGFTPLVGGLVALADIPSGGSASRILKSLSKLKTAGVAANNVSDAGRVLKAGGVSDEIIRLSDLRNKLTKAKTEKEVESVFKEAAKAQSTYVPKTVGRPGDITRTTPSKIATNLSHEDIPLANKILKKSWDDIDNTERVEFLKRFDIAAADEVATRRILKDALDEFDARWAGVDEALEGAKKFDIEKPTMTAKARLLDPTNYKSADEFVKAESKGITAQHKLMRNKDDIIKIQEEGFKESFNVNARPLSKGEKPRYATDRAYGPKKGDRMILLRESDIVETPNGIKVKNGFKPKDSQVVDIAYDNQAPLEAMRNKLEDIWKAAQQKPKGIFAAAKENLSSPTGRQGGHIGGVPKDFPGQARKPLSSVDDTTSADRVIQSGLERYKGNEVVPVDGDTRLAKLAAKASRRGATDLASDLLTPISSRLGRINQKLKYRLRKMEHDTRMQVQEDLENILPTLEGTKKMSDSDRTVFDLARKNGDTDVLNAIVSKYGLENEWNQYREVLDGIRARAKEVGIDMGYLDDYSPRMVKNPRDFMAYLRGREDWGDIMKNLTDAANKRGVAVTDLDDTEMATMVNNMIRGYGDRVTLAATGNAKPRSIETIGPELNKFYESSDAALLAYVHRMNDEIEARKFFGKDLFKGVGENGRVKNPLTGQEAPITANNSIGSMVADLIVKGDITAQQQDEVTRVLQARFSKGDMNKFVAGYRDLEYISTMGNPISAMTQFGDLTFGIYKNGWYNTLRGVGSFLGDSKRLKKEDFGLERIAQEFDNPAKTSKAVEKVFNWVGLEKVDRLGKESFVAGSRRKLQQLAKVDDAELMTDLNYMFDSEDAIRAMEELKMNAVTPRTKEVLFNRMLDVQPLAKSEMPAVYLQNPNGRIFYMLKSFTLKQFDIFRRESIDKIVYGTKAEKVKGVKNLVYLSGVYMLANASVDEMKDAVLGRETSLKDRTIDNLFRLFGATKYDIYKSREEGIGTTVLRKILPPASLWDRLSTDATNIVEDKTYQKGPLEGESYKSEAIQSIPYGKLYYWWFGRGAQKEEYKAGGSSSTDEAERGRVFERETQSTETRGRVFER